MKKLVSIFMTGVFALSLASLTFAQDAPKGKKSDTVATDKATEKAEKKAAKKAKKEAKKNKKAEKKDAAGM